MNEPIEQKSDNKKLSRRRYIIAAGIILLLIILGLVFSLFQTAPKTDSASEKIIREIAAKQLNKYPNKLKDEDFASVTCLQIGESPYSVSSNISFVVLADIKLLEKFTNLKELSLSYVIFPRQQIQKWMIVLAKLGIYDIDKRFALDLTPLEKLQNLNKLIINTTVVKNIKPISGLINLQGLELRGTTISDLNPIKNLKNLEYLKIYETQVTNLEPVRGLIKLRELDAHNTQIFDLKPLLELKNLLLLDISGCENVSDQQVKDLQKALPRLAIIR